MVKFKEINGQLCIMLEKPVSDGSAEWALWQMQQGKIVSNNSFIEPLKLYQYTIYTIGGKVYCSANEFVDTVAHKSGWQLYTDPKPLLADAKVGDLCQRKDGKWVQVEHCFGFPNRYRTTDSFTHDNEGKAAGCNNQDFDIIATEPLAPEGTAEWALQMMKLGKDVCRKGQETAYYHICNGGKEIACSLKNERRLTCGHLLVSKWGETGNDWQLYEPKVEPCPACNGTGVVQHDHPNGATQTDLPISGATQPKYEVGDWVEMDYKGTLYHRQVISVHDNGIRVEFAGATPLLSFDGKNNIVSMRLVRKLSPSEVKVQLTLEGTVRSSINDCCFELSTPNGGWATIGFNEIDSATAALVGELIEKKEGDAK